MLRRVDADDAAAVSRLATGAIALEPAVAAAAEAELDAGLLPRDHPRWVRDAIAISKAAREIVAKLRPIAIAVMSVWDHRLRCIAVAGRRVSVDAGGSYHLER